MLQHKIPDKIIKVIYFSLIAFTRLDGTQPEVHSVQYLMCTDKKSPLKKN